MKSVTLPVHCPPASVTFIGCRMIMPPDPSAERVTGPSYAVIGPSKISCAEIVTLNGTVLVRAPVIAEKAKWWTSLSRSRTFVDVPLKPVAAADKVINSEPL